MPRRKIRTMKTIKIPYQELETGRLLLRRPLWTDREPLFLCLSEEEVCRYIDMDRHTSPQDTEAFLARRLEEVRNGDSTEWVIEEKSSGSAVGMINLYSFSEDFAYIGYFLEKSRWGQGLASEAVKELTRVSLSCPGLHTLYALCFPENKASLRVLEKCGYLFDRKGEYRGGKHDGRMVFRYAIQKLHE